MHTFRGLFVGAKVTVAALATIAISIVAQGPADAGALHAAYQGAISTSITITNTPSASQGQCVTINVTVTSDAGVPRGSVTFSLDGIITASQLLPASGILSEVLGCSSSPLARALAIGPHTLAAAFVPSGNWAPAHASGHLSILAASTTPAAGGQPTGVDAGLASFGAPAGGLSTDSLSTDSLSPIVSGLAVLAVIGVIGGYRRRYGRS